MAVKADRRLVVAIDQSTTSTKFNAFDIEGRTVALFLKEHTQITPKPGWLEHDPTEIIGNVRECIETGFEKLKSSGYSVEDVKAIGVTNQRETVVAWDRRTGAPYYNAVVWSDTRTREICERVTAKHGGDMNKFQAKTGLPINTYFSAFKIVWLIENVPAISANIDNVCFGTIDTWIVWNLTGGAVFATDVTNASRTFLIDLKTLQWDDELLNEFGIPRKCLPDIRSSAEDFGEVVEGALKGVHFMACLGDQQAASLGQGLFEVGDVKDTYGTGCFLLLNTGERLSFSKRGILSTVCYKIGQSPAVYAFEGAIECGGSSINWLRNKLHLFSSYDELNTIEERAPDNGGVYFLPAFNGLFSPYWRSDVTGKIAGLTFHSGKDHIVRALLESICYRNRDVIDAMEEDSGIQIKTIRVDGGVTTNPFIMSFQSNLLQKTLVKNDVQESTCLGAAFAAGIAAGIWKDTNEVATLIRRAKTYTPDASLKPRLDESYNQWKKLVF
eukprot:TRINITY_DN10360_c0_g1_i6.p1 TRINITY_DN10360_c0_g1~~TRINITY_DN10360_c0_g1_i6.p1  ORF type:complete len:499 (+),score=121.57 TRINITY_DN10360_c0_g1_i6:54-1550(+)